MSVAAVLNPDLAPHPSGGWRTRVYHVIFQADTPSGKLFDVLLILAILASVAVVMADSVVSVRLRHGYTLLALEWIFTIAFSVEYALRLGSVRRPVRYARSFYGLVDLFSVLPTWTSLLLPGGRYLAVIRILRVLRVFRVLKLVHFVGESNVLARALWASRYKISVFLISVISVVVLVGSVMYLVEGTAGGFDSIPHGVYWAIVTLTTVGFGDITPVTPVGQALAAFIMILGYGIIAVPTGIVTAELTFAGSWGRKRACRACGTVALESDARFCSRCGEPLAEESVG